VIAPADAPGEPRAPEEGRDLRGPAIGLVAALFALYAIGPWPAGVFQDDGIYVVLAKSLATGEGYRYVNLPGAPNATHYPPLYPAFLALIWKLYPSFPENVTAFKMANAALTGIAAVLAWGFARKQLRMGRWSAGLGVLLFSASAPMVLLTVMVLSEPLFLALLFPALILAERAVRSGRSRDAAAAAVMGGVLALVRTLGVLVVPALIVVLLLERRWRPALVAAVVAVAVLLPWQLWVSAHAGEVPGVLVGKYGSYFGWLAGAVRADGAGFLLDVARHNTRELIALGWVSTATDSMPLMARLVVSALLALFLGLGLLEGWKRAPTAVLFMIAYLAMVLIWPFDPARFMWGIWPLFGIVLALGVSTLYALSAVQARRFLRPIAVAGSAALMLGYGAYNWLEITNDRRGVVQGSVAKRARPLAEWVAAHTETTAVVATDDDVLIHLYTGRTTIPTGGFTPQEHLRPQTPAFAAEQLRALMSTYPVSFVLASTEFGTYAVRGLVQAVPAELGIVTGLETGAVFAPVRAPAVPCAGEACGNLTPGATK
jgi:hypothetical protein